ncbi:MAG: hypothetical protein ABIU54_04770 [Candidatus Eisenbacteria bacterium]
MASLGSAPTRAEVLLGLGEPDRTWTHQSYLFYRWNTVRGYWVWIGAGIFTAVGGVVGYGEREHDLLFQFNAAGALLKCGSLDTWGTLSDEPLESFDRTLPVQLPIGHLDASGAHAASLMLDRALIRFSDKGKHHHQIELAPERIEQLQFHRFGQMPRTSQRMGCTLVFLGEDRRRHQLRMVMYPEHLLVLLDYLRRHCPGLFPLVARLNLSRRPN